MWGYTTLSKFKSAQIKPTFIFLFFGRLVNQNIALDLTLNIEYTHNKILIYNIFILLLSTYTLSDNFYGLMQN